MALSHWIIAASLFILILLLALGLGWWFRNNSHPAPAFPDAYSAPLGWGPLVPGPDAEKNFCQLYQFPTSLLDIEGVETVVPGNPTFNPLILRELSGTRGLPICLDQDQIIARQVEHTCTAPLGVVDGAITLCDLIEGGSTGLGGSEVFYTNSGCPAIPSCVGELSLISINFQAPTNPIFCLQNNGTGADITMAPCDPSLETQLFRVTRTNPGQNPNSIAPGQGQNGLLAQILDRERGLCVVPGTGTTSTVYDPDSIPGCSGTEMTIPGPNVILGTCTVGSCTGTGTGTHCTGPEFPGYVWALLPSLPYCTSQTGCAGCTGCPTCIRQPSSNVCSGCPGCTGLSPMITPQQIVYVGDFDFSTFPSNTPGMTGMTGMTGLTGTTGLTGPSAIVQWLVDNDAQSMYYGGSGDGLILNDLGLDVTVCPQRAFVAQYINLSAYNTISEESACYAAGTLGTQACIGL